MFLSQENKGFLWDLMLENDTFKKEIDNNMIGVKTTFDNLLTDIDQKNNEVKKTTIELINNKKILKEERQTIT